MLDEETHTQLKWIIARSELVNYKKRGSLAYQKPASDSTFDMHKRVSGLHLGLRAVKIPEIVDWVEQLNPNLFKVSNTEIKLPNKALADIGITWEEYECEELGTTVHSVLEFINYNKGRVPVVFDGEFWYHQKIIGKKITEIKDIQKDNCLVMSLRFFTDFKIPSNIDDILSRCSELKVPVLLDLIWMPLIDNVKKLKNTDCIQVITYSFTKTIPIAGIKGGFCFWKKPVNEERKLYPLGNRLGSWISQKYLEEFGYNYVKDSLRNLQSKWCKILGLETYDFVMVGKIPEGHRLEQKHIHSHLKMDVDTKLFSLISYYENDIVLTKFLEDIK